MEKRFLKHFAFWLAYLSFEIYTEFVWMSNVFKQFSGLEIFKMAFYPEITLLLFVKLPLIYISFYCLQKLKNVFKLSISLFLILLLFSCVGFLFYKYFFISSFYHGLKIFRSGVFQGLINSFMDKIFILGTAIALKQYSVSQKLIQREQTLLKQKIEAELNFLKSQINPHFLFNTLNNIYSFARKKSDDTADVVMKLSKLLRFILYETQNKKITIKREIQFLEDYIELEKIRYDSLDLKFNHEIDNFEEEIAPLLLIPIIENAFKHGASQAIRKPHIYISIKIHDKKFEFTVENSFDSKIEKSKTGIGLQNLKRQLEILYPKFFLTSNSENSIYKTMLFIDLN